MMRKTKLVVTAAIAGLFAIVDTCAATAADAGAVPNGSAFFAPAHDWSGAYAGLNIGYGFGRTSDAAVLGAPALFTDTAGLNARGVVGGGQIGYNLQFQNLVLGLEADFQGADLISNHSFSCPAGRCSSVVVQQFFVFPGTVPVSVTASQRLDLFGTIRGRAGVAVIPEVLLYGTGGLAYGQVDTDSTLGGARRQQNFVPGWTVGGGVEGAVGGDWTVRLEYLHLELPHVTGVFTSNVLALGGGGNLVEGFNSRLTDNIVRIGLNYRFFGPTIAKY
jgi:outer membrane immunogenic protein